MKWDKIFLLESIWKLLEVSSYYYYYFYTNKQTKKKLYLEVIKLKYLLLIMLLVNPRLDCIFPSFFIKKLL